MLVPWGADIHEIDVVPLAKLFPAVFPEILRRLRLPGFRQYLLRFLHTVFLQVAKRHSTGSVNVDETGNRTRASHTKSNETDSHRIHRISRKLQHILLTGSWFRLIEHNDAILDLVILPCLTAVPAATGQYRCRQSHQYQKFVFHSLCDCLNNLLN